MRLIHTSDWHLGKYLEGFSRLEEQERFCDDFVRIVEEKKADLVIIAGDVYDTSNPPAMAETLFYNTIRRLSDNGKRAVFIIAGNHDNPDRLESVRALADTMGITILGYPLSSAATGTYEGFEILAAEEGFTKMRIGDEAVNILSMPYPSEKRLNEAFSGFGSQEKLQETYSQKVGDIFRELEKNYREDEINIAVSHIFVAGSEKSDSERRIELGGSLLVEKKDLPEKSQYTALGHIHKPQRISRKYNAYYSGSPIQYSKNERNTAKSIYMADLKAGCKADVAQIYINNYKQIAVFNAGSVDEAIEICKKHKDDEIFAYFEIMTDDVIDLEKVREMKNLMENIIEIKPVIKDCEYVEEKEVVDINRENIEDFFRDFFTEQNDGLEPSEGVVQLFNRLVSQEVDEDEAD